MKSLLFTLYSSVIMLTSINSANALEIQTPLTVEKISISNIFTISQNAIIDGTMFNEMSYSYMLTDTIWWLDSNGEILIDFGAPFIIHDALIQVDANDTYYIDYSIDKINWSNLFTITPEDGESLWAMDTMSTDILHEEYVASLDFTPVQAKYIKVSASGGDNVYYLTELQVFGNPTVESYALTQPQMSSPVPNPPTLMLFSTGIMLLMALQYRRKKQASTTLQT